MASAVRPPRVALFDLSSLRPVAATCSSVPAKERARARAARAEEADRAMERMRRIAAELGRAFGLRAAVVEAERAGVNGHYGACFEDGTIRIRLRHAVTGRLLKESSLVDTLCHELAHLRHFDHATEFRDLYFRILEEARARGWYRPGPEWRLGQRPLFGEERCGAEAREGAGGP